MRKNLFLANMRRRTGAAAAACNDPKDTATAAESYGPSPTRRHRNILDSDGRYRLDEPLARGRQADRRQWHDGHCFRDPARASAHRLRTAERRRAGRGSNAPPKPDDGTGIKGFVYRQAQKWAGAGGPSANRITLLRDADGDGVAETRSIFLSGLNSPFGMVLVGEDFYVADSDAIMKFP